MPQRLQRKRAAGWRMGENGRCVTRPGVFSNPFSARAYGKDCHGDDLLKIAKEGSDK